MSVHFDRAFALYTKNKYALAEKEFRLALAEQPENGILIAMISLCLTMRNQYQEALKEAKKAIEISPEEAIPYYSLAQVYCCLNQDKESESVLNEAIRIDPGMTLFYSLLATLRSHCDDWKGVLEVADRGLKLDPEHKGLNNHRALALIQLGRKKEADQTIEVALKHDPENASTHFNKGWAFLHEGKTNDAMGHFTEALRLNPDLEKAKVGLDIALKARNPIYRFIMPYYLWVSALSDLVRWSLIIVSFLVILGISLVARNSPDLAPYLSPFVALYLAFRLITWTVEPVFCLILQWDQSEKPDFSLELFESIWHDLVSFLAFYSVYFAILAPWDFGVWGWLVAIDFFFLNLPIFIIFQCKKGWPRKAMIGFSIATVGFLPLALAMVFLVMYWGSVSSHLREIVGVPGLAVIIGSVFVAIIFALFQKFLYGHKKES